MYNARANNYKKRSYVQNILSEIAQKNKILKKFFKNRWLYTPSVTTILRRPTGIRSLPTAKT